MRQVVQRGAACLGRHSRALPAQVSKHEAQIRTEVQIRLRELEKMGVPTKIA